MGVGTFTWGDFDLLKRLLPDYQDPSENKIEATRALTLL